MQQVQALSMADDRGTRLEALILPTLVLLSCAVYILSPVTTSTNSAWTFHLAASILRQGNLDLDEYRGVMNLQADYRLREVQGHVYSYYPVATPLLVTPALWLINKVYPLFYPTDFYTYLDTHGPDSRTAKLEKLLASGIVALAAGLIYLIARRELDVLKSLIVALIFSFSTSMWSTASRALWQHGPSALFLALGLYLLLRSREKPWLAFWLGLVLGFSYLIRPTNSLAVGFVGLYLLVNHRSQVWLYVCGVGSILVPFVVQNWLTYGNMLPPYSYQLFERLGTPRVFAEGLAGTLISPARGLFIFSSVSSSRSGEHTFD